MRALFTLIIILIALWAIDAYVFDGRYGGTFEQQSDIQGRNFHHQVQAWLDRELPSH
jgi:hypothetical protein